MDMVVNWFILILVVVFDPLAVSLVVAANHLAKKDSELVEQEKNKISTVETQITDAVTIPQIINQVDEIPNNIETEFKKTIKKDRKNKKKNLEMTEKNSILEESLKNKSVGETNTENFYGETVHPTFEYRRGVKL